MEIDYNKLVEEAIKALDNALVNNPDEPRFGAAVLTDKGNIYSSGQYQSDSYTLTLHAEQAAFAHAAAHGETRIVGIASVSSKSGEELCFPCSMCRQIIWESSKKSGIPIKVIGVNINGKFEVKEIKELVPYPWPTE